jgi:hypothetical protein
LLQRAETSGVVDALCQPPNNELEPARDGWGAWEARRSTRALCARMSALLDLILFAFVLVVAFVGTSLLVQSREHLLFLGTTWVVVQPLLREET